MNKKEKVIKLMQVIPCRELRCDFWDFDSNSCFKLPQDKDIDCPFYNQVKGIFGRPKKKGKFELIKNPVAFWRCGDCGRTFTRLYSLRIHMARIHNSLYTLLNTETKVGIPSDSKTEEKQ